MITNMTTPVTAIQTTSLQWQRSVPGKRSRSEKVKKAFAVYMVVARIKCNGL